LVEHKNNNFFLCRLPEPAANLSGREIAGMNIAVGVTMFDSPQEARQNLPLQYPAWLLVQDRLQGLHRPQLTFP